MPNKDLIINEIFFSIQGESTRAGMPCVFVRLAHCDLRCSWCDTEYAFYEGTKMSIKETVAAALKYPCNLVEITGGEPLLQEGVHDLVRTLLDTGKVVLIETGGHRDISRIDPRAILILDLKCPDSKMAHKNRWDNLPKLKAEDEIKFVLASRTDYDWAKEVLENHDLASHHSVHFSPVWQSLKPELLAAWILEDGLPVRLQLQLHKVLWGDKRGV
jgi:7-carboxy-7-deazaguanine synthase